MFGPIFIGLLAALAAALPRLLWAGMPGVAWTSPFFILGVAVLAMVFQRFIIDRKYGKRSYEGVADLVSQIHSPSHPHSSARWGIRGCISFLLALFGGTVGPEGAAAEFSQGMSAGVRSRTMHWSEERRRSDAAMAIGAAVSAAFHAPFAAVILPLELGIGGRTISVMIASTTAFLGARALAPRGRPEWFDIGGALYGIQFTDWRVWVWVLLVAVLSGVICLGIIHFFRYSRESLFDLFHTQAWMRALGGGLLLFLVILVYRDGHTASSSLLEQVLWSRKQLSFLPIIFVTQLLTINLAISAFGTVGVFWPLFALGGYFGYWISRVVLSAEATLAAAGGIVAGSAFLGAILGIPLTAGILAFELTQNTQLLLPSLVAALLSRKVRSFLGTRSLPELSLDGRGVRIANGRSLTIMESICVRDAMVTDFETLNEQETVSDIHARLLKSRYPFLPVVNSLGAYVGLITVDMVQDAWEAQDLSGAPLGKLLEAKDLLYRSDFKPPTLRPDDRLSIVMELLRDTPCVVVLSEDSKVVGILLSQNIRLAYDREVARRALSVPPV